MSDRTDWITAFVFQGYGMDNGTEVEIQGNEVAPGTGDKYRINTLDTVEAADYINILEEAMLLVIAAKRKVNENFLYDLDDDIALDKAAERMDEILGTDALVLVQQHRKEKENDGTST